MNFLSLNDASEWATDYLGRTVTLTNISYLIQYGKVKKMIIGSNRIGVNQEELKKYYDEYVIRKQNSWKNKLGDDLNWDLSFDHLREVDTTKHVHRLHPYKGKFIPQLVEYFLNENINTHKKEVYFHPGDIVLDPFMGSGTTLVQAAELGINSIGIDVSDFNCLISKVKLGNYDIFNLGNKLNDLLDATFSFSNETFFDDFDTELKEKISVFNREHFPSPEFKFKVVKKEINEYDYAEKKLMQFLKENNEFLKSNGTKMYSHLANENQMSNFLAKWFSKRIKQELFHYIKLMEKEENNKIKQVMRIVLSRTARSCRATTHSDLATLKEPQIGPYYCRKHKKICTPINSILKHLRRNTIDTIKRLKEFSTLKKEVHFQVIHGDSRVVNVIDEVNDKKFKEFLNNKKVDGVFTSPPYVGQIDYHEQHAYAYELFDIPRADDQEIGPLYKGQGMQAKEEYVNGVSEVFKNISQFVKEDGSFFIVANDKFNLYPKIADNAGLKIVHQFKRPVLNRTERDRQPYAEIIFHMKKIN